MKIDSLQCECGSDDLVAIAPGEEEVRDFFLLRRERPIRAWCMPCWQRLVAQPNEVVANDTGG